MSTIEEKKSVVGLRDLYIALVSQDDASAYAAGSPQAFAPAVNASHRLTSSTQIQYADDGVFDQLSAEGETKIELEVTNIPLDMLALVLGKTYDGDTGRFFDHEGEAPDVALSFRSVKSNGAYKYFQYLKGRFSTPDEDQATKADKVDPKTLKITFTAVKTTYEFEVSTGVEKGVKRVIGDEDISGFDGADWFDAVQVPVMGSPSALTCTPSPADAATGVTVSTNIVLTFSNPLAGNAENGIVLTTVAGVIKACSRTLNAARTVVTLDPTTNMAGATQYLVIVPGVTDIYGQSLADAVYDFTTA
jgi:phi13 family phage major tail protein